MTYNLQNSLDVQSIRTRLEQLIKKACFVDLTEKKPKRSIPQNSYLHVCLSYFACQVGESLEYVKRYYYKYYCNRDLFMRTGVDKLTGQTVTKPRSSSELDTKEMTLSIERFRNFAAEHGYYIPAPHEEEMIIQMQIEVERNKQWL